MLPKLPLYFMSNIFQIVTDEIHRLRETPNSIPLTPHLICQYASKRLIDLEPNLADLELYYAYNGYDDSCEYSGFTLVEANRINTYTFTTADLTNFLDLWYLDVFQDTYMRTCDNEGSIASVKFKLTDDRALSYGIEEIEVDSNIRGDSSEYTDCSSIGIIVLNFTHSVDKIAMCVNVDFRAYSLINDRVNTKFIVATLEQALRQVYPSLKLFEQTADNKYSVMYRESCGYIEHCTPLDLKSILPDLAPYDPILAIVGILTQGY